jgi:hypothetical protein
VILLPELVDLQIRACQCSSDRGVIFKLWFRCGCWMKAIASGVVLRSSCRAHEGFAQSTLPPLGDEAIEASVALRMPFVLGTGGESSGSLLDELAEATRPKSRPEFPEEAMPSPVPEDELADKRTGWWSRLPWRRR